MANLPTQHYIEVGQVADVVRLAADGVIPADAGFSFGNDDVTLWVNWFGYPKTDDAPARVWSLHDNVSFEGAEGEPML